MPPSTAASNGNFAATAMKGIREPNYFGKTLSQVRAQAWSVLLPHRADAVLDGLFNLGPFCQQHPQKQPFHPKPSPSKLRAHH